MCLEACPTYQITRLETESPRGRIHLMINMLEGGPRSGATQLHLDRCLACRACEVVCPSGVPYGQLIEAAHTVIADVARPRPDARTATRATAARGSVSAFRTAALQGAGAAARATCARRAPAGMRH